MKRRILSVLTALALCLSLLPVTALAAGSITYISYTWVDGQGRVEHSNPLNDPYNEINTDSTDPVTWNDGWYVVTGSATFTDRITVTGNVHLILTDNCTLTASKGISVNEGNSLTIYATSEGGSMGKLIATGADRAAGIGGTTTSIYDQGNYIDTYVSGGTITIHGGDITATGKVGGAGIGGGVGGTGGNITIYGGVINATSVHGAGVGGGDSRGADHIGHGGRITIYGGTVNAANTGVEGYGAGIGGGGSDGGSSSTVGGSGGTITIYSGVVKAESKIGAGIGGGQKNNGGEIAIFGGDVEATSRTGAGIGSGAATGNGTTITGGKIAITGGKITAKSTYGAGIGGGNNNAGYSPLAFASGGTISITGSNTTVTATGGQYAYDIGSGGINVPSDKIEIGGGATVNTTGTNGIGVSHVADTTKWVSDDDNTHSRPCQVENCDQSHDFRTSTQTAHALDGGTIINGELVYTCEQNCGYEKKYPCTKIEVTTPPTLTYDNGQPLDLSGLTFKATFENNGDQKTETLAYDSEGVSYYMNISYPEGSYEQKVTNGYKLDKYYDNGLPLYVKFGNGKAEIGSLVVKSTDTRVRSVTVGGEDGKRSSINEFSVVLDKGATIPTNPDAVQIVLRDTEASNSTPVTNDSGQTWTFTVTAESGATQQYTIHVSVTPPSDAECVAAAKAAIEGKTWTVAQADANSSEAVKSWIEGQLAGMDLYGMTASVTMTGCAQASGGANGSFGFTVALSKNGENDTATVTTGTITATPVTPPPTHSHSWAGGWTSDGTHHWHECIAGGCTVTDNSDKYGYGVHVYDNDTDEYCNTCNFKRTVTPPPATEYTVTVNGSYATVSGAGNYEARETVAIDAGSRSNYRFNGWTSSDGITFANAGNASTTFVMPDHAVTVTANWTYIGETSGGGGGGGYTPPTYPPTVEGDGVAVRPRNPEQGDKVTVTPKPDEGWEVDGITVTDRNGRPVDVTQNPDGTYTFTQPSGKVTVKVTYRPIEIPWRNPFTDVSENDWYYEAVRYVHEQGLMNGYSDGRFGPNDMLSRAQLAQILFNKEGRPGVNYLMDFSDVAGEAWYTEAIRWATAMGIVSGYGGGRFGPNDSITREQLAVMLWRYSGSPAATNKELHFADADKISGYALEAMRWAVENGIISGYGNGQVGPGGQATRAQVAQMLMRFFETDEE